LHRREGEGAGRHRRGGPLPPHVQRAAHLRAVLLDERAERAGCRRLQRAERVGYRRQLVGPRLLAVGRRAVERRRRLAVGLLAVGLLAAGQRGGDEAVQKISVGAPGREIAPDPRQLRLERVAVWAARAVGRRRLLAVGRRAVGRRRLAVGRLTVGRLAVGRLAVGRLAVGRSGLLARFVQYASHLWAVLLDERAERAAFRRRGLERRRSGDGDPGLLQAPPTLLLSLVLRRLIIEEPLAVGLLAVGRRAVGRRAVGRRRVGRADGGGARRRRRRLAEGRLAVGRAGDGG